MLARDPNTRERCTYGPWGILVPLAPRERKVVYAEDDDLFRSVVTQMLTSAGVEVHECRDGVEAVELCCEIRPDAALFDLDMPRLDGFSAARRLRQNPALLGMRIIAITGRASLNYRMRAVDSSFDQFLCKPIALEPLLAALHMTPDRKDSHDPDRISGDPASSVRNRSSPERL
jgi:CheY-like chemotaxis protein